MQKRVWSKLVKISKRREKKELISKCSSGGSGAEGDGGASCLVFRKLFKTTGIEP